MLDTLLKIGKWQSQGKSEWDRFLEYPKIKSKDKFGNEIKNYVLPIIFDLDDETVIIDSENLKEYDERDVEELKCFKIKGGNNKATYVTAPLKKLIQIYKTFFGKEGEDTLTGQIIEASEKLGSENLSVQLKEILEAIFKLKESFLEQIIKEKNGTEEISHLAIEEKLDLERIENIVLLTIMIKSSKHGYEKPVFFSKLSDYLDFTKKLYFKDKTSKTKKSNIKNDKICYVSGSLKENVGELDLDTRYSLNKMFVTETRNYANDFYKNKFSSNYQVSKQNQEFLDYASNYLLNEGGYKIRIANIDHVIIPQFRSSEIIDWDIALEGIQKQSDILFHFDTLENMVDTLEIETNDIFWINFLAYESDGNYFKTTEIIKDVSNFHFSKILKAFYEVYWDLKKANFVDWESVMTEYGTKGRFLNFNTFYSIIPLRKDKEKKNKVLNLFKSILENRRVDKRILYNHFSEFILCHWYERYASYTNVNKSSKDYFNFSIRDSVFKYHAFFLVLKKLKLINMEQPTDVKVEKTGNKYDDAIQDFFEQMDMQNRKDQQAMFYLGRMLNTVEWVQLQKKIKKTVINLVNFNGLDKNSIERLRNDLINKAKQHSQVGKVKFLDGKYGENFKYNGWDMDAQEALFFLLTGYSYRVTSNEAKEQETVETIEIN